MIFIVLEQGQKEDSPLPLPLSMRAYMHALTHSDQFWHWYQTKKEMKLLAIQKAKFKTKTIENFHKQTKENQNLTKSQPVWVNLIVH